MDILTTISLFATAMLFGGMVFFAAFMTPLVFIKLDGEIAGQFLRDIFPWYYLVVICLGAVAAVALIFLKPVDGALLAGVAGVGVVVRQVLLPDYQPGPRREAERRYGGQEAVLPAPSVERLDQPVADVRRRHRFGAVHSILKA